MSRATHVVDSKHNVEVDVAVMMPSHYSHGVYHGEIQFRVMVKGTALRVEMIVYDQNSQPVTHYLRSFDAEKDLHVTSPRRP